MLCLQAGVRGIDTVGRPRFVLDIHLLLIFSIILSMTPNQLLLNGDHSKAVVTESSQKTAISKNPLTLH